MPDGERALFHDWTAGGETSWADPLGGGWRVSADGAQRIEPRLTDSIEAAALRRADPFTRIRVQGSFVAPGAVRITGVVSNRRGYMLPSYLTSPIGRDDDAAIAGTAMFEAGRRETLWDTTLRVSRQFELGRVDLTLVGEATASFGGQNLGSGAAAASVPQASSFAERLTSRALRIGAVFGW